jgi:four helix bundle protein
MMASNPPTSYHDWQVHVPETIRNGPLWQLEFYRRALFLYDLCWFDCESWLDDVRGKAIANQITRSCGSISANIEEGYGRGFGRDYARFLSIAVGSARETQGWYLRSHYLLGGEVLDHRLGLCDEIIGSLVKTIAYQRRQPKR